MYTSLSFDGGKILGKKNASFGYQILSSEGPKYVLLGSKKSDQISKIFNELDEEGDGLRHVEDKTEAGFFCARTFGTVRKMSLFGLVAGTLITLLVLSIMGWFDWVRLSVVGMLNMLFMGTLGLVMIVFRTGFGAD
ncbi:hypothetical protein BpHYR1_027377 [Brachionus plicatilis]|uniref:Uncharacterized protein n=1 Tax=Brachionus plicatilis TaxID=10195 RepID=A0A3M7RMR2_BRAPC|nr:hypothetical protein BpHYR1_027377 [Brachionus plicatilis]